MNRKLVNALLLVALASGSCSMFTSCKDTDEDFQNEIITKQVDLEKRLKDLDDRVKAIEDAPYATEGFVTSQGYQTAQQVDDAIKAYLSGLGMTDNATLVTSANAKALVDGFIKDYLKDNPITPGDGCDCDLSKYVELQVYKAKIAALSNLIAKNEISASEAKSKVDALENQVNYFISAINDRLDNLITDILLNKTWNPMFGSINIPVGLNSTITANYYGLSNADLKFPFDTQGREMIDNSGVFELSADVLNGLKNGLTQYEVKANVPYMNEYKDKDGKELGNLGRLYLSINPAEIDATSDKITYSLVNSQGVAANTKAITLAKSDEVLKFGITRAGETSNLYEAQIGIDAANASEFALPIADGLKSSMKEALKNRTKSDLLGLAKVLVNQMKDLGPAYAIKATWETMDSKTGSVASSSASATVQDSITLNKNTYSYTDPTGKTVNTYIGKYEIAATTVHPLGYHFMDGEGLNKDLLPTFGSIKEAVDKVLDDMKNKIVINTGISGVNWTNVELNFSDISFPDDLKIVISLNGLETENGDKIQFNGSGEIVLGYKDDGTIEGPNAEALKPLIDAIATAVNKNLTGDDANSLKSQIENKLIGQVNDMVNSINSQLKNIDANIQGSINTSVNNIKDMLSGKLGRLDNILDKYNSLANRINNLLKNPNNYLQVTMVYEDANGGLHHMSANKNAPTRVKSGSGALDLYATSYTAEIVAPSCKKYVAIGRVWNGNQEVAYADAAKDLNSTEFINEVVNGNQNMFSLDGSKLKKGYKYEVIYSSLDYNGYTSTRTFYFTVVD